MTDITVVLDATLKPLSAHLNHHPRDRSDIRDEFLKEAYRINANISSVHIYLQSIRQSYLSTSPPPHRYRLPISRTDSSAPEQTKSPNYQTSKDRTYFTDAQRDQIDAESKATLRDLNAGIRQLEEAEQLRRDTERTITEKRKARNGFKALGRWAAGGIGESPKTPEELLESARQETIRVHRDSVIWFLRKKLGDAADLQGGMMQRRLEREVEKSKSVLYKTKGFGDVKGGMNGLEQPAVSIASAGSANGKADGRGYRVGASGAESLEKPVEQTLSPEQLQLFAQENSEMLKHYEDTLDKVRTAERSMIEISELQTTLAANLETQSAMIGDLVLESLETRDDVAGGNKELKRAAERKGPARWVFRASCGLCVFLVLWDFFI